MNYELALPTPSPGARGLRQLLKELQLLGIQNRRITPLGPRGTSGRIQRIRFSKAADAVMAKLRYQ